MDKEAVYYQEKSGKLRIKDSVGFLKLLSGADENSYRKLEEYAKKILNKKAPDIPQRDQPLIINMAITLAFSQFDENANTNFLSYFYSKLRGEISSYRAKKKSMIDKVNRLANSGQINFQTSFDEKSGQNKIEEVDLNTEEQAIAEDLYKREVTAFRMAFGSIPLYYQYILNLIAQTGITRKTISEMEDIEPAKVDKIINTALSLILTKVLRSNHLDEEEKKQIMIRQGIL